MVLEDGVELFVHIDPTTGNDEGGSSLTNQPQNYCGTRDRNLGDVKLVNRIMEMQLDETYPYDQRGLHCSQTCTPSQDLSLLVRAE